MGYKTMKTSTALILVFHLSLHTLDEGHAINPGCHCLRFTSTYGKERGTFSSPDYPRAYPPRVDCLLYTFLAAPHEIVEVVFTDFDIYKEHLEFYNECGIPGVIGCVDGTHIAIVRPVHNEERFFNRKQYHSLNVQIICDSDLNILSVDASYPGATNDATVWQMHPLYNYLLECRRNGETVWVLGDSGYPQRTHTMTPILNTTPGSKESIYTKMHMSARNCVERCIGVLKARFRCLLVARTLHYDPQTASQIVNACCVLHNIAHQARLIQPILSLQEHQHEQQQQINRVHHEEVTHARGQANYERCIQGDYLKVYSEGGTHGPGPPGVNEYSAWSRSICGNRADAPPALYSHGPLLVLEFHSGLKASNATGFVGTYRFIDRRNFETDGIQVADTWCDFVFNSQPNRPAHGRLYSPRYPSSYPSNIRCTYHFNARQNERIKLVFEESFLQKGDESCLNRADIIKVFDGRLPTAPVLALICNEVIGYDILSSGPDLLVQFTANSNTPGQGFKASYQFQMDDATSTDSEVKKSSTAEPITGLGPAVSAATSSCDQVFRSDKSKGGKLTSPLYPKPYLQKTQCHYDFLARGRDRIRLVFEDFSLQRTTDNIIDCESMDSLDVFLYVDGRLEKMISFCGDETPKPIMSNGPKLSLEFRGMFSSRRSRGFKLSYSFVEDYAIKTGNQLLEFPCAFVYNSSERTRGIVTSPNYPGLYPRDTECNYFFYGFKHEKIRLHFTHFDVEGVLPCEAISASDYVQFSSQMIDSDSRRYCGQLKDLHITSDQNFLRITFKSNDRLDGTGFKADYIFLRDSEMHSMIMPETAESGSLPVTSEALLIVLLGFVSMLSY